MITASLRNQHLGLRSPPVHFAGSFNTFFQDWVASNLPPPDSVEQFSTLIDAYLSEPNPIHIVRSVVGLERGQVYQTNEGCQLKPSDNAPAWWVHALLMSNISLPNDPGELFDEMPTHMFGMSGIESLNSAGYHLAHLAPAKNRNTAWRQWSRLELERRFLVNVHPCNWFLVAKQDWQKHGGRADIIEWVCTAYQNRYGSLFTSFMERVSFELPGSGDAHSPRAPEYKYGDQAVQRPSGRSAASAPFGIQSVGTQRVSQNRPIVKQGWLGNNVLIEITTCGRRFLVPHDDLWGWVEKNTNVPNTKSWQRKRLYSWPKATTKMLEFLELFEI